VNHGHGPVGHRVELVEAAWLEAAGHEEQVDARRNAVRHRDAEAHPPAALLVPVALHLPALAHVTRHWCASRTVQKLSNPFHKETLMQRPQRDCVATKVWAGSSQARAAACDLTPKAPRADGCLQSAEAPERVIAHT